MCMLWSGFYEYFYMYMYMYLSFLQMEIMYHLHVLDYNFDW